MEEFDPALTPTPQLQITQKDSRKVQALHSSPTSFNSTTHYSPSFRSVDYADEEGVVQGSDVTGQGGPHGSSNFFKTLIQTRSKRPAKFPAPVDQFFAESDPVKVFFAIVGSLVSVLASYHHYGVISEECMENLLILLALSGFLLSAAILLQKAIPEVAVVAMLAGASMAIASVYVVILSVLPLSKGLLVIFLVFPGYFSLLLYILYKIYKEDVREPANKAGPNAVAE